MKKAITLAAIAAAILTACSNEGTRTGNVDDTAKVSPPTGKMQDSTSLTDTGYSIGDSVK